MLKVKDPMSVRILLSARIPLIPLQPHIGLLREYRTRNSAARIIYNVKAADRGERNADACLQ